MPETSGSLCSSTTIFYYPASQKVPQPILIFACVINGINSILSVLGNIVILSALRQCQTLHLPSKALLCSLALSDLVVGLLVLPLFITYHFTIILEMTTYYCTIAVLYGRISSFIAATSLLTIVTIAAERYLAFHLRLRYRVVVTFKRVVSILILEWILTAVWAGSWFWSIRVNMLFGAAVLFCCCVVVPLCYLSIYRGLRGHFAIIHHQHELNTSGQASFNVLTYKKTVINMLWIYGFLLVCYVPYLSSTFAMLITGPTNATRFAVQFSPLVIYFNSSLNPVLYCWRIKELNEKVKAKYTLPCNLFTSH